MAFETRKVSVVIPCFNDGQSLLSVVEALMASRYCGEVVVVDDGSGEETREILASLKQVKVICHEENRGKAAAMLTGLSAAVNETVAFIDADLKNFKTRHFDSLVKTLCVGGFDMVMGVRGTDIERRPHQIVGYLSNLVGFPYAYTGERIFKSKVELIRADVFGVSGYLIEPMMNKHFFHKKKSGAVVMSGVVHPMKTKKFGLRGYFDYSKLLKDYYDLLGAEELVFQCRFAKNLVKKALK